MPYDIDSRKFGLGKIMDHAPGILMKLESSPLFNGVAPSLLLDAIGDGRRLDLARGATLLRPGIPNSLLYIILSGRLSLFASSADIEPLAMYGEGDCVGEMAILDDGAGDSTMIVAATDCQLLALNRNTIWSLIDNSHEAAHNILKMLAQRIRIGNQRIQADIAERNMLSSAEMIDPLTGLYTRSWMNGKIERLLERCRITGQPGCLLLLEMDGFEQFSDSHGELGGDEAIRTIAHTLLECMHPEDEAGQFTERRFGVFLPNTALSPNAQTAAERLRSSVNQTSVVLPSGDALPPVSISLGITQVRPEDTASTLVARTEQALQEAISAGGNRCCSIE